MINMDAGSLKCASQRMKNLKKIPSRWVQFYGFEMMKSFQNQIIWQFKMQQFLTVENIDVLLRTRLEQNIQNWNWEFIDFRKFGSADSVRWPRSKVYLQVQKMISSRPSKPSSLSYVNVLNKNNHNICLDLRTWRWSKLTLE